MTMSVLRLLLLASAVIGTQASGVIERQVNGVTRNILYHSRMLQGYCVPKCTKQPTKQPVQPPVRPPTCTCPAGQYVRDDCTCSPDCCGACTRGTFCVKTVGTNDCKCIGCECGFCDRNNLACCNMNGGGNNCNPNNSGGNQAILQDCRAQDNRFPHLESSGNVCSGVEISNHAVGNGCGCKPNEAAPCLFNAVRVSTAANRCFVCDVQDFAANDTKCNACKDCIKAASTGAPDCIGTSVTADDYSACLGRNVGNGNKNPQYPGIKRAACTAACLKSS